MIPLQKNISLLLSVILISWVLHCACGSVLRERSGPYVHSLGQHSSSSTNVTRTIKTAGEVGSSKKDKPTYNETAGYPVILIPGDGGNQLDAVLNKSESIHFYCEKHSNLFTLWLDLEELLPGSISCFTDNIRLVYNNKTRRSYDAPGVNVSVPGFGDTETVEWLDPDHLPFAQYFVGLVRALVARGYKRGFSVRGAPFDFRKAPNTESKYFDDVKKLVEETYQMNNNRKVVIITHSLGGMFGLYFLNQQTQEWKDKYIQAYAPISAPFAGAVKVVRLFASGDNLDELIINPLTVRPAQRTYPSSAFLLPSDQFWAADEVLVFTPYNNYTVKDYKQFFLDLKFQTGIDLMEDTRDLCRNLTAPGVPVFHVHGSDVPTPEQFFYDEIRSFPNDQPIAKKGQGDGTVNMRSLKAFLKWKNEQKQPVQEFVISGMEGEHLNILQNEDMHHYMLKNVLFPKKR